MENKIKNEMEIEVGGEKILLRPTFENLAAMETKMGGIAFMSYKFGQGVDENGKIDHQSAAKALPSMTDAAQIIYFNQAEKKYSLDQIMELCLSEGIKVCAKVVPFLGRVAAGNKFQVELSEKQKKS